MNKRILLPALLVAVFYLHGAAQETVSVYNPNADAKAELNAAVARAAAGGKHVFVQVGGNWCPWCMKFNKMITTDAGLDSLVRANYEVVHVNYSKENKNTALLASLGYPQRFGFPVFLVLDGNGRLLHTQDSELLELDKGYNRDKVVTFLRMWSAQTLREAREKYGDGK